ncbi:unnamed protein product [Pieris macdunnoughi]|uniref:Uncharacterized protein n=1 Tax=Pieris macdunnoughi TaxID=345717 RepID=A0A821QCJ8_9NEOP|nr:unnamed protein product [Pieris macdunnoughi]
MNIGLKNYFCRASAYTKRVTTINTQVPRSFDEFHDGFASVAADAPRWWAATAARRARRARWRRGMSSARSARPERPPWRRPRPLPHNAPIPSPRRPSTSLRTAIIAPICYGGSSARATAAKVRACARYVDTREARPVMQPGVTQPSTQPSLPPRSQSSVRGRDLRPHALNHPDLSLFPIH